MARYNYWRPQRPRQLRRQARITVRAEILPLLAQLNREFGKRSSAGTQAIAGYTNQLASQLAPMQGQTHQIYAGAQAAQRAEDTALANRLSAAGVDLGGELNTKLAAAGIPTTQAPQQIGSGAAAAGYGIGSAALAALIGRGAAAENYAGTLPGIARLGGQQRAQQYGTQLESERASQAADLRAKIPGLTQQVLADLENREFQKQAARLSYGGDILSYKARAAATAETARGHTLGYKARVAAIKAANTRTGMTLKERAARNQITDEEQAKRDQERARHNRVAERQARRRQWYREHQKKKGGSGGGPPSANK
jgi:hypothetical protein